MGIVLGANSYGKAGNHLFKVVRGGDRHEVRDYRVDVALTGDYEAVHTRGRVNVWRENAVHVQDAPAADHRHRAAAGLG